MVVIYTKDQNQTNVNTQELLQPTGVACTNQLSVQLCNIQSMTATSCCVAVYLNGLQHHCQPDAYMPCTCGTHVATIHLSL